MTNVDLHRSDVFIEIGTSWEAGQMWFEKPVRVVCFESEVDFFPPSRMRFLSLTLQGTVLGVKDGFESARASVPLGTAGNPSITPVSQQIQHIKYTGRVWSSGLQYSRNHCVEDSGGTYCSERRSEGLDVEFVTRSQSLSSSRRTNTQSGSMK